MILLADRTTKVTLTAQVSGYLNGMDQAARKTREFADGSAQKLAAQEKALTSVGTAFVALGAVAAAAVALAVKSFADFDAKMSQVKTLSHATAGEMEQLTKAALTMGQAIGLSATETADAEIELVKAGVSVKDIMGGALKGSLDLAAAGQIAVGKATEIATIALTQFGLKGKDVPHVADLLAAGADKALGGVDELGQAMKQSGLVAAQFGISVDDTVGALSAFANAGLIGSDAGTSFKQMLLSLASPSVKAQKLMDKLGLSAYDAQGHFIGVAGLAGQLQEKLGGLSDAERNSAESIIFGSDAIRSANVLYVEGQKGMEGWTKKVDDSGFAAQQARGKMDNLQGDLKKLQAAFQTGLIETGGTANGVLRGMVKNLNYVVTSFSAAPEPIKAGLLLLGGVVSVVGLVGGTALLAVPKIAAFKAALGELNWTMKGVSLAGGAVGLAITGLVTVLSVMAGAQADAKQTAAELADTLDKETGAVTKNTRAYTLDKLAKDGSIELGKKLGISAKTLVDVYLQVPGAVEKVKRVTDQLNDSHSKLSKTLEDEGLKLGDSTVAQDFLTKTMDAGGDALKRARENNKDLAEVTGESATKSQTAGDAYQSAADKASALADAVAQLTDQINTANGVGQDAVSANADYQKALADADATIQKAKDGVEGYSLSLDESTVAGSTNAAMLAALAASAQNAAKKQLDLDGDTAAYQQRLKDGHQAVVDRAIALGATAEQAEALADKVAAIPTEKEIKILTNVADAQGVINRFIQTNDGRTIGLRANVTYSASALHVPVPQMAGGGTVGGTGGAKADTELTALSTGEEVIQNPYASMYRSVLKQINAGTFPRFAGGGTVGRYMSPAPQYASSSPATAPQFNVVVQSKGGIDLLKYVDVSIQQADRDSEMAYTGGVR